MGSLRLYDSCEEDEDAVVEVLVAVALAIKAKEELWKRFWESLKRNNNGGQEKFPNL